MMLTMPPFHKTQRALQIHKGECGFTLIELLVVLAIMSLSAVLFIGASGSSDGAVSRSDLAKLENEIATARQQAITFAARQEVDLEEHSLELRPTIDSVSSTIVFYPDGSSNGGTVMRDSTELFDIRWIDGRISK